MKPRSVLVALALTAAYVVTGRLGLLLSVAPGFATSVWMPSGVALFGALAYGAPALPAAFLGSFLLNLWCGFGGSLGSEPGPAALAAALVGVGALAQTAVGARLIRRSVGFPTPLTTQRDIVRFLLLGGPVACLVNPTWSTTALRLTGHLDPSQAFYSWANWWAGDTIGVVTVTPVLLCFLARPRALWRRRVPTVGLPLLASFVLVAGATQLLRNSERTRTAADFDAKAEAVAASYRVATERYGDLLRVLAGYLTVTPAFDSARFVALARTLGPLYPGLRALEWVPLTAQPPPGCQERLPGGRLQACGERPYYAAVAYAEPLAGNELAIGFDLASSPERRAALDAARRSGRPTASGLVRLVQNDRERDGLLLVLPLAGEGGRVRGFVAAVFQAQAMATSALQPFLDADTSARVDFRDGRGFRTVATLGPAPQPAEEPFARQLASATPGIDGLVWTLVLTPSPAYLAGHWWLPSWLVITGAVLTVGLLAVFLMILTGRTERLTAEVRERRRVEAELVQAKAAADAASAAKSRFLAALSHELRTPLGAVMGFSELLASNETSAEERERMAAIVRRNGDVLSNIVNDVLDLAKVEAGKLTIEGRSVVLAELLGDLTELLGPRAREKGLTLTVAAAPEAPERLWTDGNRLRQILLNLLGNALKFTETGGIALHARPVTAADGRAQLAFAVTDTGPGISAEQRAQLFQPFGQVHAARHRVGTGLGLVLSQRFAEALGGDVALTESRPGQGSTFTATVDVTLRDAVTAVELGGRRVERGHVLAGRRVLLVEDGRDNQLLVTRFLRQAGATVEVADDGAQGVAKALAGGFDVVLMDLGMPVMDGHEATSELRRLGYAGPIVALSAHALADDVRRCRESGFDAHLAKPIDGALLVDRVASVTARVTSGT